MLYENIVSDSVYVSKEILFEISPTEEDEIALSVGYGTTHWMRSPRFSQQHGRQVLPSGTLIY